VLADVLGGMVSVEAAQRHYGVAIRDGAVDAPATAALRTDRPAALAFHRGSYADVLD
jgi:N-methylhydantoinase B